MAVPPPPPGFVINGPAAAAPAVSTMQIPSPPPGFVLTSELRKQDPAMYGGSYGDVVQHAIQSAPSTLWEGLKQMGSTAARGVMGLGNPGALLEADARARVAGEELPTVTDLKTIGATAAGTAGAGALSAVGVPAVAATTIGSGLGLLGWDKVNQLFGNEAETTPDQDLKRLVQNSVTGAVVDVPIRTTGALIKGAGKAADVASEHLTETAQTAKERSLGIQYGDRKGGLGRNAQYLDAQGNVVPRDQAVSVESSIQEHVARLESDGFFDRAQAKGQSGDAMSGQLVKENAATGSAIQQLIGEADARIGPTAPAANFSNAAMYIDQLKRENPALAGKMSAELSKIEENYSNSTALGLSRVNAVKRGLLAESDAFAAVNDKPRAQLYRAAYSDLMLLERGTFDAVVPNKAGALGALNDLYSSQSALIKTLDKRVAKGDSGFLRQAAAVTGSGPYVGAGAVGSILGIGSAPALAGGLYLANAFTKGMTSTKPVSVSRIAAAAADKIGAIGSKSEQIASLLANLRPAATTGATAAGSLIAPPAPQNIPQSIPQSSAAPTLKASDLEQAMADLKPRIEQQEQPQQQAAPIPTSVDPALVESVIYQESMGRANAVGPLT